MAKRPRNAKPRAPRPSVIGAPLEGLVAHIRAVKRADFKPPQDNGPTNPATIIGSASDVVKRLSTVYVALGAEIEALYEKRGIAKLIGRTGDDGDTMKLNLLETQQRVVEGLLGLQLLHEYSDAMSYRGLGVDSEWNVLGLPKIDRSSGHDVGDILSMLDGSGRSRGSAATGMGGLLALLALSGMAAKRGRNGRGDSASARE